MPEVATPDGRKYHIRTAEDLTVAEALVLDRARVRMFGVQNRHQIDDLDTTEDGTPITLVPDDATAVQIADLGGGPLQYESERLAKAKAQSIRLAALTDEEFDQQVGWQRAYIEAYVRLAHDDGTLTPVRYDDLPALSLTDLAPPALREEIARLVPTEPEETESSPLPGVTPSSSPLPPAV
jgi:hypothetical protein